LEIEITNIPKYSHFHNKGKGIFDIFNNTIIIYYPNIKNPLDLFLTYYHEVLHYLSYKLNKFERLVWFLLDYRKWYIQKCQRKI